MKNLKDKKLFSIFLVCCSALLWSIGAPIGKIVHSPTIVLVFFRGLSGLIALVLVKLLKKDRKVLKPAPLSILGGLFYAASSFFFYSAITSTTAANATVLVNTSPFFIAILGFLILKEKPALRDWLILLLIVIGIILCFIGGISLNGSKGDLMALLAALFFSIVAVIMKKNVETDPMQPLIWGNLIAVIATAPAVIGSTDIIYSDIPFFIILGIFQMALPYVLYAEGQRWLGVMEASLFKLIEPIVAPVWVALLIGEVPAVMTFWGGGVVIGALFLKTYLDYRSRRKVIINTL